MSTTAEIIALLTPVSGVTSQAFGINSDGTVIGTETSKVSGSYVVQAFMVSDGSVTLLSPTPSTAYGINDYDEIVGFSGSTNAGTEWYYGLYSSAISSNLSGSAAGFAINDSGAIAGNGSNANGSQAFVVSASGTLSWLNTVDSAAVTSAVYGINSGGTAVGYLQTSLSTPSSAISWLNGTVTVLPSLSAGDNAVADAINTAGLIVGSSGSHAVEWLNGAVSDLGTLTGYTAAAAFAVNDNGQIVGVTFDSSNNAYATLWSNGKITNLNTLLPANSGWVLEFATGINDQGLIVGYGSYNGVKTAFEMSLDGNSAPLTTAQAVLQLYQSGLLAHAQTVYDTAANVEVALDSLESMATAGDLTAIYLTDASTPALVLTPSQIVNDTQALAKIAGAYTLQVDATDANMSFTAPSGHSTTVLFLDPMGDYRITPLANGSGFTVTDIHTGRTSTDTLTNVSNLTFSDGSAILKVSTGTITVQNLGSLSAGTLTAASVDDQGDVTGFAGSSTSAVPYYWSQGALTVLQPLSGAVSGEASHVTDAGLIVGESYATNNNGGSSTAVYWLTSAVEQGNTQATSIGWLSGDFASLAFGANDRGQIIGESYTTSTTYHGFLWQNGTMINIGSLGGSQVMPWAINDNGEVVGKASLLNGNFHAFSYQNGIMTDLGTLTGYTTSAAEGVNMSGTIAGYASNGGSPYTAVYWSGGQIHQLVELPGFTSSFANAINDKGWMVGEASNSSIAAAMLWANGTVYNLNSLLPSGSGWLLGDATSINDEGQVVGIGTYNGQTATFELTLPSVLPMTAATAVAYQYYALLSGPVPITDSALDVVYELAGLNGLVANGELGSITLTDSGTPNLSVTATQLSTDSGVLNDITSGYTLTVAAGTTAVSIAGIAGHATTVQFSGDASQYTVTEANGVVTVTSSTGVADQLSNVASIQFADTTEIVAATPSGTSVTTGNVTELYAAVLDREPDVAGLGFYQNYLKANPGTALLQFAEWFLQSPEYTSAHSYAETTAGDQQFIIDSYQNLLHRTPSADEIAFYQDKVMTPALTGLTAGTQAYANAQLQAHALMLVYFSASAEFLNDVQITAAHPADAQHWLILT